MNWLKGFINNFWESLKTLIDYFLDGLFHILKTILYWIFDGFLTVVTSIINALDLSALGFEAFGEWANLPPEMIYIINQFGLPQCCTIIVSAIGVRMLLNLIPASLTRI